MPNPSDLLDLPLLRSDRTAFLLRCQRIIGIVVRQSITRGLFPPSEHDDIVQSVNEELFRRLDGIERNFDGSVLLNTYVSAVLVNICRRLAERARRVPVMEPLTEDYTAMEQTEERSAQMLIDEERRRLERYLQMYGEKRRKLTLCLKILLKIAPSDDDLRSMDAAMPPEERTRLRQELSKDRTEAEDFAALALFVNRCEHTITSGNSLRRWTSEYLVRIVHLMNGDPPKRSHTKETIRLLMEQPQT